MYAASFIVPLATTPLTYPLICTVSDSQPRASTFPLSLGVLSSTSLAINLPVLPGGTEGVSYSQTLTVANASLYPTLFPQGGLSDANTLRVGAFVNYDSVAKTNTPLIGVLDDRFGGIRIEPTCSRDFL